MGKICSKCKKHKQHKHFYKSKSHKDGYRSECKECSKLANKGYKPRKINKVLNKICNVCHKKKSVDCFRYRSSSKTGTYNTCKMCLKSIEYSRYKIKPKFKVCKLCGKKLSINKFNKSYKNKDGHDNRCKQCLSEYYDKNREKIMSRVNKWRKDNPKRAKVNYSNYVNRRRARKMRLNEKYSVRDRVKILKLFKFKCVNCGSKENLTVDHFNPLSKGFVLKPDNAIILCVSCNSSKNNLDPIEFFSEKKFKFIVSILSSQKVDH